MPKTQKINLIDIAQFNFKVNELVNILDVAKHFTA